MPKIGMEEIRRQQVIRATLRCIIDEGLEKVTLDKVAQCAGVSKGVVAYYFKSKKNLLVESYKAFYSDYIKSVEAYLGEETSPYAVKDVLKYMGGITLGIYEIQSSDKRLSFSEVTSLILQFYSKIAIDRSFLAIYKEMYEGYQLAIHEIIDYGNKTGECHIENVSQLTLQLMGLLEGLTMFSATKLFGEREALYHVYETFVDTVI